MRQRIVCRCLAAEKFVPKFCEKVTERSGGTVLREGWGVILCVGWARPVGNTDGDQSEAKTTTIPHRAENVLSHIMRLSVHVSSGCVV